MCTHIYKTCIDSSGALIKPARAMSDATEPNPEMLRVLNPAGEVVLAIPFEELVGTLEGPPARVRALKRYLQPVCGQLRFKQRLLLLNGDMLSDDVELKEPVDLQLILLPYAASSNAHVKQLEQAARMNDVPAMELLLQRPQHPDLMTRPSYEEARGIAALHRACQHGSIEAARLLLEATADVNMADGFESTPIFYASQKGYLELVRLLLEAKADPEKDIDFNATTPMHRASQNGHLEVLKLLLEAKANKDKRSRCGRAPIHLATQFNQVEIVRLLLEAKADKDVANNIRETPVYVAAHTGCVQVLRVLLEARADKDKANYMGGTPISMAKLYNHREAGLLLSYFKYIKAIARPPRLAGRGAHK